jgi:hypothetical protein
MGILWGFEQTMQQAVLSSWAMGCMAMSTSCSPCAHVCMHAPASASYRHACMDTRELSLCVCFSCAHGHRMLGHVSAWHAMRAVVHAWVDCYSGLCMECVDTSRPLGRCVWGVRCVCGVCLVLQLSCGGRPVLFWQAPSSIHARS